MEFDRQKLSRLIHYVIWRAGHRPDFGVAKLNKALWLADARHYMLHGRPITGETYVRHAHAPVPKHLDEILSELQAAGAVTSREEPFTKATTITRYSTDSAPDTSCFNVEELSVVDWWIKQVADEATASADGDVLYRHTWEIAAVGEPIPLNAVLASRIRAPLGEELEWAKAEAQKLGLT